MSNVINEGFINDPNKTEIREAIKNATNISSSAQQAGAEIICELNSENGKYKVYSFCNGEKTYICDMSSMTDVAINLVGEKNISNENINYIVYGATTVMTYKGVIVGCGVSSEQVIDANKSCIEKMKDFFEDNGIDAGSFASEIFSNKYPISGTALSSLITYIEICQLETNYENGNTINRDKLIEVAKAMNGFNGFFTSIAGTKILDDYTKMFLRHFDYINYYSLLLDIEVNGYATLYGNQEWEEYWQKENSENPFTIEYGNGNKMFFVDVDKGQIENAQKQVVRCEPLIFDLDNDGTYTKSLAEGTHFDFGGDGFAEKTGWVDSEDGMLVRDINKNGMIDNGGELFGDKTLLTNGSLASNGFQALSDIDSNKDKIINSSDSLYNELGVWIDSNFDGISQADEIHTLEELEIKEINLKSTSSNVTDVNGNLIAGTSTYTSTDGTVHSLAEIYFAVDSMDTIQKDSIEVSDEIKNTMPNLVASGNMLSLHQAMTVDSELKDMVTNFVNCSDPEERQSILKEIVKCWTGSENITANSRGTNIDASILNVIEQFYGTSYKGVDGPNPNAPAAVILNQVYNKLLIDVSTKLLAQTQLKTYLLFTMTTTDEATGETKIDYTVVKILFEAEAKSSLNIAQDKLANYVKYIKQSSAYSSFFNIDQLKQIFADTGSLAVGITLGNSDNWLYGNDENNSISGTTANDTINAGTGNDKVSGGAGDDIITGGTGNDNLYGEAGNDTYIFNLGDGQDTIFDSDGTSGNVDTIAFGEGIKAEDVTAIRKGDDLILSINGTEDKITIQKYYYNGYTYYQIEKVTFADGTVWDSDYLNSFVQTITGTDGDDTLTGFSSYSNPNEIFNAGAGNDMVYGYNGNDTIIGGTGNDTLKGEAGNDTYIFNLGDGQDTIYDVDGTSGNVDTISINEDYTNLIFSRNSNDLKIALADSTDSITISSWFSSNAYHVENITASNGYELSHTQVDLLIQSMSSFGNENGMTWTQAIEQRPEDVQSIASQMWIKQSV